MKTNVVNIANFDLIKNKVETLIIEWQDKYNNIKKNGGKIWTHAISFMIYALDQLIVIVQSILSSGPEKKALVLGAISFIYDKIVYPILPIWMKPLNGQIKAFFITLIISTFIDYIVSEKKNSPEWQAISVRMS